MWQNEYPFISFYVYVCIYVLLSLHIKSPSHSGVILCYQFVFAAAPASAAAAFNDFCFSRQNRLSKSLIFGIKKVYVGETVLGYPSVTLTQGHGCGIDKQKNCLSAG